MEKFRISFKKSVAKDLRSIPKKEVRKILEKINRIAEEPRSDGSIKLTGKNYYRVRQGNYRIIYEIRDRELVIVVIKVGNRSTVYRNS
jgi:mRNA interferase RelE/StbE